MKTSAQGCSPIPATGLTLLASFFLFCFSLCLLSLSSSPRPACSPLMLPMLLTGTSHVVVITAFLLTHVSRSLFLGCFTASIGCVDFALLALAPPPLHVST